MLSLPPSIPKQLFIRGKYFSAERKALRGAFFVPIHCLVNPVFISQYFVSAVNAGLIFFRFQIRGRIAAAKTSAKHQQ
jgi:hypothetical protein